MNILIKIRELANLTNSEKELADYILANPRKTLQSRPKELATAAFVSTATIYRLINKLGLNGVGELKIEIASSLRETTEEKEINYDYPILESDTPYQIMTNLNQIYKGTLDETLSNADPEELVRIGEKLINAKIIDVYAASANLFFAQNFRFQMQEIGILINVPEEDYIQRLSAANSDKNHVALVISYGGRSETLQKAVKILSESNTPIILITSMQENALAEFATHKIYMASAENHYNKVSSFSTRQSLLSILDTIYSIIFNYNYDKNIHYKTNNYQKMNNDLI
ncbi:MurR/RpiR family transcriptional regulator [Listeria seeligeri]|uniref:MurR/RpiR family transcriptional regulator n=1 Tax=Listeria seeligeri TaxID=1640 RepID=UPI0001C4EA9C|nr:MurR/RpiR family transcriptional regulator [Listeria seeligeri]MBC1724012.1 MurR/RpiR family transcriptional regulator [Listeria seeligeri]MBF2374786.1 MurR/RpiR family transcriptional regulator [Listeria seeligeri]MBF2437420.1 MurR/RpiR family transcriptional regulator [Listeria seeligeri]MBF2600770.1 MurR/RpiR family transcriptional regulator [Listeria seeligeri]CBH28755.1 phosphosugar-binding transcriptional regulator, RpiR family [Listeria seeligeri serovar 1/2b str. SLCC3954]